MMTLVEGGRIKGIVTEEGGAVATALATVSVTALGEDVPWGSRPLGWVTDNWTISGVVRMMTGGPTTPSYSLVNGIASPSGSPDDTARPQVIDASAVCRVCNAYLSSAATKCGRPDCPVP